MAASPDEAKYYNRAAKLHAHILNSLAYKTAHNLELPGTTLPLGSGSPSSLPVPMSARTAFDLIFRNARTRSSAIPGRYRRIRRPDRRHRTAPCLRRARDRCRRQARSARLRRHPHPSRQGLPARPLRTRPCHRERGHRRGRGHEARFHRRGRLCPRRPRDRTRDRARHHADAHPCRDRSAHRAARLRGDQGAEARLCLGDRPVDLRVSAGRPDQRSRRGRTS